MKFYTVKDVIEITGLGKSASYSLIKKLNKKLEREYPGTIVINAKIPKWYFNEKIMIDSKKETGEIQNN